MMRGAEAFEFAGYEQLPVALVRRLVIGGVGGCYDVNREAAFA
jgi:hypothetical protein